MNFIENIKAPLKDKEAVPKIGAYFAAVFVLYVLLVPVWFIGLIPILGLLVLCTVGVALMAALVIVTGAYYYEYAQAGMQDREAVKLWEADRMEQLKKVGKLFLVQAIYSIPAAIFYVPLFFLSLFAQGSSNDEVSLFFTMLLLLGVCIFYIALFVYGFYVITPAALQLVKTNTFSEAFKFKKIYTASVKNKAYNQAVLWQIGMVIIMMVVYVAAIILSFLIIGLILWPFIILGVMYYTGVGLPYALGKAYVGK